VKKNLLLLAFIILLIPFLSANLFAQNNDGTGQEKYSQVRIFATSQSDFQKIQNAGLFLDGGVHKQGLYFETTLSDYELYLLRKSGVPFDILVDDWIKYYQNLPRCPEVKWIMRLRFLVWRTPYTGVLPDSLALQMLLTDSIQCGFSILR